MKQKLDVVIIAAEDRRAEIKRLVRSMPHFSIAGEIGHASALRLVPQLSPDVIILDGAMSAINPLATLALLAADRQTPHVVALAATESPTEPRMLLELGAISVARLEQPATLQRSLERAGQLANLARGGRSLGSQRPQRRGPFVASWFGRAG